MFAKLFSRITESSLMEQPVMTRWVFVGLLAIADPQGHVIGTDVAIARRLNVSPDEFLEALQALMAPDADSNSPEMEGRRVVESDCGRGYRLVNYLTYRNMRDEEQRRDYMRGYMRDYMRKKRSQHTDVRHVKHVKLCLAQAEAEAEAEACTTVMCGFQPHVSAKKEQSIVDAKHEKPAQKDLALEVQESKPQIGKLIEEIYAAYPRKVGRPAALVKIRRALSKIDGGKLLELTRAYSDAVKGTDPQFVPHPATWFGQERYNDDPKTWKRDGDNRNNNLNSGTEGAYADCGKH
jgi:hypothetical protein